MTYLFLRVLAQKEGNKTIIHSLAGIAGDDISIAWFSLPASRYSPAPWQGSPLQLKSMQAPYRQDGGISGRFHGLKSPSRAGDAAISPEVSAVGEAFFAGLAKLFADPMRAPNDRRAGFRIPNAKPPLASRRGGGHCGMSKDTAFLGWYRLKFRKLSGRIGSASSSKRRWTHETDHPPGFGFLFLPTFPSAGSLSISVPGRGASSVFTMTIRCTFTKPLSRGTFP